MVSFTDEQKYYLYPYPMDMRKDIDSLSDIVREEMCLDPSRLNGVFIFISKKRNIMKILYRGLKRFELTKIRLDDDKFLFPVFDEERKSSKRVIYVKDLTVTTPEGRKIELIKTGKTVGFELDTNYELHKADNPCAYSARFQSIIGTGNISFLTNNEDKVYALSQIMFHNTGKKEWQFATKMLDTVTVFKLNVKEMSCKSHK